jgi:hypothetical protein
VKIYKTFLHVWITIVSLLSFLGGWAMLAHSRKPIQPSHSNVVDLAPLPTLAPIQAFGNTGANSNGLGLLSSNPRPRIRSSFLSTSGS